MERAAKGPWDRKAPPVPLVTQPICCKPRNAMKSPMLTPMARFRLRGMAIMTRSRTRVKTRTVTKAPSTTTTPIMVCQLIPGWAAWTAKAAFSPMPLANANG